ncbi:MAG: hypothetical protein ACYCSO_05240 [Cuniculiplasma sp.]
MSKERKCTGCGKIFESDEEARKHKCPNVISTDKPGVWNPSDRNEKERIKK